MSKEIRGCDVTTNQVNWLTRSLELILACGEQRSEIEDIKEDHSRRFFFFYVSDVKRDEETFARAIKDVSSYLLFPF